MADHRIGTREEWQAARDELQKLETEQGERNAEIRRGCRVSLVAMAPREPPVAHLSAGANAVSAERLLRRSRRRVGGA